MRGVQELGEGAIITTCRQFYRFYYDLYDKCFSDEANKHFNTLGAVTDDQTYSHDENIQGECDKYI